MKNIWSQLRKEATPSQKFSENLRAQIYETATKKEAVFFKEYSEKIEIQKPNLVLSIERSTSFIDSMKSFIKKFHEALMRFGFMLGGGAIALLLIVPLLSLFTISPSSASDPSFLRNIEGTIAIERTGIIISPEENTELFNTDIITTNSNSSVEIIFFEGTVLRMAENSQIEIQKINQHPFLFSSGGITVKLKTGKVWVKTFQMASKGTGITLKTPNTIIYPEKSGFAAVYLEGKESVLMMDNKATIELNGLIVEDNIEIHEGEMIQFTPFDQFTPLNEAIPKEWNMGWIAENIQKDKEYTTEYLERISLAMKEQYVLEELSNQVQLFLGENPDPDKVEELIAEINRVMLIANKENIEDSIPSISPTPTEENIESSTPSPKEIIQQTQISSSYRKQNQTAYSSEKVENIKTPTPPSENIEPISIENKEILEIIIDEEPVRNHQNAAEIAQKFREQEQKEKIAAAAHSFSEQINSFEFENSRTTKAQNILNTIEISPQNLKLLEEIEKSAPEDVKEMVKIKKQAVEKKAKELEIKEYKNNLKHSAPENNKQSRIILKNISSTQSDIKIIATPVSSL